MMRRRVALPVVVAALLAVSGNLGVIPAGAAAGSANSKCTKKPFVGTVERTAEASASGQPTAQLTTSDVRSALVYDFGSDKNFTVYAGDYKLAAGDLGGTLTAPEGKVLVTMFLRSASGKSLTTGTKLVPGKDPVSVLVDAGAGAIAVTSNPSGTVTILKSSKGSLCFAIDYHDDYQDVDGVVNAAINR